MPILIKSQLSSVWGPVRRRLLIPPATTTTAQAASKGGIPSTKEPSLPAWVAYPQLSRGQAPRKRPDEKTRRGILPSPRSSGQCARKRFPFFSLRTLPLFAPVGKEELRIMRAEEEKAEEERRGEQEQGPFIDQRR